MRTIAETIVWLLTVYICLGLTCAAPFLIYGLPRIDKNAEGASIWFRLIILPGFLIFYPLLMWRWFAGTGEPPPENNAHRRASLQKQNK